MALSSIPFLTSTVISSKPYVCPSCARRAAVYSLVDRSITSTRSRPATFQHDGSAAAVRRDGSRSLHSRTTEAKSGENINVSSVRSVRRFHTGRRRNAAVTPADTAPSPFVFAAPQSTGKGGVRDRLRKWQEENAHLQPIPPDDFGLGSSIGPMSSGLPSRKQRDVEKDDEEIDSESDMHMHAGEDVDEDLPGLVTSSFTKVGDLVEIPSGQAGNETGMLAVKVRGYRTSSHYLGITGAWYEVRESKIAFRIPGWTSEQSVQALQSQIPEPVRTSHIDLTDHNTQSKPSKLLPVDLASTRDTSHLLISRMQRFDDDARELYRKHADVLDNAYESVAKDSSLRFGSLTSLASRLFDVPRENLSHEMLWTVQQVIRRQDVRFAQHPRTSLIHGFLQIRPKIDVERIERVIAWIRDWRQDEAKSAAYKPAGHELLSLSAGFWVISDFMKKARRIVMQSRQTRQPTDSGCIGPSSVSHVLSPDQSATEVTEGEEFTRRERDIIRMLELWASTQMLAPNSSFSSLPPTIIEATGLYKDLADGKSLRQTCYVFLQELGVILPWHARQKEDEHLILPTTRHSIPLRSLVRTAEKTADEHMFQDSLADIRHDWGSLPVYCIDGAGAQEIDDGISIEPGSADLTDEKWWIHVHVANPTAYLTRTSPLSAMARQITEKIYMLDSNIDMLPSGATHSHWSLAPGRPCMTISALLDSNGHIVDTCVRAGTVNNVVQITPDELSQALTGKRATDREVLRISVGAREPEPSETLHRGRSSPTTAQMSDFVLLDRLARRRHANREVIGGFLANDNGPQLSVFGEWGKRGLQHAGLQDSRARVTLGDPVIEATFFPGSHVIRSEYNSGSSLVQECMLLANEAAGLWAEARNVPLLYRGVPNGAGSGHNERLWREMSKAAIKKHGGLPRHLVPYHVASHGHSVNTTRPVEHAVIGVSAYCKVTSPLRRFRDMVNHWQLQATVQEEARTGRSLLSSGGGVDTANRAFLPYNDAALHTVANGILPREEMIARFKKNMTRHWLAMLILRAHDFKQASLPATLTATVLTARNGPIPSWLYIHEFGLALTGATEDSTQHQAGDIWEVAIDEINVFRAIVCCKLVRLIKANEDTPETLLG